MADGLSFVFQIDSNTPGLDDLLGKLDKANVSFQKGHQGLKGLDEGARRAGKGAEEAGGAFEKALHQGLEPFLHHAEKIAEFEFIREGAEKLLEFPGELIEKVKDLSEEIVLAAAHEERLGRAFQNALGPEVGKETLEYFDAIADKTEFTHGQIKGMGLELAKSGFKGENLKNAVAAAADLASMTENPVMGGTEAVDALKRIMTTGRIEGRALVPFGIQKGEFEKELSAETGLGVKAMRKEMEAGKIPIETTLNSLYKTITNKTNEDLGGVGTAMTDTLTSRLAHLGEKPDLFFESMKDTQGYREFSDFIGRLGDALDPNSTLGKILSGSLESAFDSLGDTLQGIDLEKVIGDVGDIIKGLPDDIHKASDFFSNDFVPAVQGAWQDFKDIKQFVEEMVADLRAARDFIDPFGGHGAKTKEEGDANRALMEKSGVTGDPLVGLGIHQEGHSVKNWIKDHVIGAFVPGYDTVKDAIPKFQAALALRNAGQNDMAGYKEGVLAGAPAAVGAMSTVADATVDALKEAHRQHSPSALFRDIGENDITGYIQGVTGREGDLADLSDSFDIATAAAGGGAGGGGPTVVIEGISVTVQGGASGDSYEHGRLIARGMEDEMELLFLRVLERIAKRKGG